MMKIAAFYYTQTGQGLEILRSVCRPLAAAGCEIIYKEIVPETKFPYPWTYDAFFQAFPESREAIGCLIRPVLLDDIADANLVIIAYQPWFLSPSIPIHGFFQDKRIRGYLNGKNVITVSGCRNMWIMAQKKVREYILQCGGKPAGNIVLQDRMPNLISVATIVRWLIDGKKTKSGILPGAGVSQKDIRRASLFGDVISNALVFFEHSGFSGLQEKLVQKGAIQYKPSLAFIERAGHRIFGVWSKFVLKKGAYGSPRRAFRLKLFKYYLFTVLYLISPVALMLFYLCYPFRHKAIRKDRVSQSRS
jgi:hypothetical protein